VIRRRTLLGPPVEAAGRRLQPVARAWELRLPAGRGGLVWLRPVAVRVGESDGEDEGAAWTVAVRDPTRRGQLALLALGLLAFFVLRRRSRRRRPRRRSPRPTR
jgi:hypothetical protein